MLRRILSPGLAAVIAVPIATALVTGDAPGQAPAKPTFTRDVLPIIQRNCQVCHRPQGLNLGGMVAPMPLTTYEEVLPWRRSIALAVHTGYMPPWHASEEHRGKFTNERVLTRDETNTLLRWVESGVPPGDPHDAPPQVDFASDESGWSIGEPDLVLTFAEPYLVRDSIEDEYVDIEVPIPEELLPEDRWIKAVEFRPGSKAVHHIIARPLGGIAPGYEPQLYADGYGRVLRQGTTVNFQMHYHKQAGPGTAVYDQTEVAIRFYQPGEVIRHIVETESLGMWDFVIPAGEANHSDSTEWTFQKDVKILWLNPHMHLRGKAAQYFVTYPDGRREELLHVPNYDFNWQHYYRFVEPVVVPKGSKIELTLWWDNSADNPSNPNPNRDVRWGLPTTDEMGFGWVTLTEVEPRHIVVGEGIPADYPRRPMFRRRERNR